MRCGVWLFVGVVAATTVDLQPSAVPSDSHPTPLVSLADNSSSEATETQQATCQVVTEKLVAKASATVTHALKGVCATKDLEKHFLNLRSDVRSQLGEIKIMLLKIDQHMAILKPTLGRNTTDKLQERTYTLSNSTRGPRDLEINQYNYTTHFDVAGNDVFSYFWKVDAIQSKVAQQNQHVVFRSPSFYVNLGYRMYIKILPHQDKGNVYIHVGLTHGQYDDIMSWPFALKHRVTIIDQTTQGAEDISSQIWDPASLCSSSDWQKPTTFKDNDECLGFGFTQGTIFTRNYICNDSLLIKLDVFVIH